MNGNDQLGVRPSKAASFEAIFGYVLLGISILGIILTLTVPWYTYEISIEYEGLHEYRGSPGNEVSVSQKGSYTYSEIGERDGGPDSYGTESKYMENGARYVLWGFILLILLSILYLLGLLGSSFRTSASILSLGVGKTDTLNMGHRRSLKLIAILSMWVPAAMVAYGASRFIGYTRALSSNVIESSKSPFYVSLTGDYGSPAGYIMFITGIIILGGVSFYFFKFWLKPLQPHGSKRGGISSATKSANMLSIVVALVTLGYIIMPMFSIITTEEHVGIDGNTFRFEFYNTDGGVHDLIYLMEEEGVMILEWEEISSDLYMMQWALFAGMVLSILSLMGIAITLANPKHILGLLMQNSIYLIFIAAIIFLIGQIMLWSDIPGLTSTVATTSDEWSRKFSYGNNYFPFITYLLAIPATVVGCVYLTPFTLQIVRSKEYAGRGAYSGTGAYTETIPLEPYAGGGFSDLFREHRKPIIACLCIITLIVAGILVYSFVDFGDEGGSSVNVNVQLFNVDDFNLVEGSVWVLEDYATEEQDYTFVYEIDEPNVSSVYFLLTWTDEEDTGWIGPAPNHENQPDTFTIIAENPSTGLASGASGSNSHGQEGFVELIVPISIESVPSLNGTGGWNITLWVVAGDHEPVGPGAFKFLDNGNDFTLEVSYTYYIPRE